MAVAAFDSLQRSLSDARKDLESTNESIKKITGQEAKQRALPRSVVSSNRAGPSENNRRPSSDTRQERTRSAGNLRAWNETDPERRKRDRPVEGKSRLSGRLGSSGDLDLSENKRRDRFGSRSRLADRLGPPVDREKPSWRQQSARREEDLDSEGEEDGEIMDSGAKKPVQSSVVALPAQPRPKADPNQDQKSKKRNQRMFGFLMNTLRKFKDNETTAKTSAKERRRSEIEDKVEKTEELEKETAQMERKELYDQQKAQRVKIGTIAKQMDLAKSYTEWNAHDKLSQGYIETKAIPPIFYLPKENTSSTEQLVAATKDKIEEKINKRLKEIDSFVETANSVQSAIVDMESDSNVGGPGEEVKQEVINGGSPEH